LASSEIVPKVTFRDPTQAYNYVAYGLSLSSNLPIAALLPTASIALPEVQIKLGDLPLWHSSESTLRYASSYVSETGEPDLRIWDVDNGEFFRVLYRDGVEFWLDRGFRTLWAYWPASSSLENALSYLVGPILGLLLRLRGIVCLHASAVSINNRAVVFVGSEGMGKSTTAAAFARRGYPVLSDDIVALVERGNEFQMLPGYPRVNLWPDSVELLYGSPDALPQISPNWEKRCLSLREDGETRFEEHAQPIGGIYVLGNSTGNSTKSVEVISRKTALMTLIGNTYATNFIDSKQRAEEFQVLSRLVANVPVRKINRGKVIGVEEFCATIHRNFTSIDSPSNRLEQ
jgi:hypothetical protein